MVFLWRCPESTAPQYFFPVTLSPNIHALDLSFGLHRPVLAICNPGQFSV